MLIIQPAGTVVPFENVKFCSTLRRTETSKQKMRKYCDAYKCIHAPFPDIRGDALKKLSTFLSLPIADLIQIAHGLHMGGQVK